MRPTVTALSSLLLVSLAACGERAAPEPQTPETGTEVPAPNGETAPADTHPDLSAYEDAEFFLDYTFAAGQTPLRIPEGLGWEADGGGYLLTGTLDELPDSSGFTGGVALEIPTGTATVLSGHSVEVFVVASAPQTSEFALAYSTNDDGDSGWHRFEAGETPQAFTFTFDVPAIEAGSGDYIGIAPLSGGPLVVHAVGARMTGEAGN